MFKINTSSNYILFFASIRLNTAFNAKKQMRTCIASQVVSYENRIVVQCK